MKIDKQVHVIFRACPDMAYDLAGLPSPGPCKAESPVFKGLERRADMVFVPDDVSRPVCVAEVQFQWDEKIYTRIVVEMALLQEQGKFERAVQGVIFFGRRSLDPATKPWSEVIHAVYLDEALERMREVEPEHLALDVFAPVWVRSQTQLEASAKTHYNRIRNLPLAEPQREAFLDAFLSWLFERFKTDDRKYIAMILDLPDITETVAGKELIEIGIERGIERGREEGRSAASVAAIRKMGEKHFGAAPAELDARIVKLPLTVKEDLVVAMMDLGSWEDVTSWMEKNNA